MVSRSDRRIQRLLDEVNRYTIKFNNLKGSLRAKNNRILELNSELSNKENVIIGLKEALNESIKVSSELSSTVTDLEKKNVKDQEYIKLMNQVLDNVHLEYVWRAVKQVLRDINVTEDFTDENYKEIMESACRILTEDKRDILKQAWNNFLLFFNEKNKLKAKIVNLENCVLENTSEVMNDGVYEELYGYFTASKSPSVYHWNKDVRKTALNLLDDNILKSYPSEKKRKSISNKFRNTRNKTTKYLKNKRNETSNFLKKKSNQTRNFFKNKRQNITQKVGNLRKRLFGKKNNWRNIYNRKTLNNKTLSNIQKNNFMGYDKIETPERILRFRSNEKPKEAMKMNSKNNKFPLLYGYIDRVNGPSPPPPRRFLHTQSSVSDSEINPNKYDNSSNNNENTTTATF